MRRGQVRPHLIEKFPSLCAGEDSIASASRSAPYLSSTQVVVVLSVLAIAGVSASCGSGSMSKTPPLSGNTAVTVMLSSTGNDQLSEFDIGFLGMTLTSHSGKTVTLIPTSAPGSGPGAEFVQMNGTAEPFASATIPQDIYTSASATLNGAEFICIQLGSSDGEQYVDTSTYDDLGMNASAVTVSLPAPITVSGDSMGLLLDLKVSESATYSACYTPNGVSTYSITPTFSLSPLSLSSMPTNAANGKMTGLKGEITALGTTGNSFTLTLPDAEGTRIVSLEANGNTVYQGISNSSALAVGTFVDLDAAIQSDGSLLATRVAVEDTAAGDVLGGPLIQVIPSVSTATMLPRMQQGPDFICCYQGGSIPVTFAAAVFQISGQLANLASLPFVPSFNASNMVPGQSVYLSVPTYSWSVPKPAVATMTLMPQTINGTIAASSQVGNFTDYTVTLAPYNLFPMLAVQPFQTNVENNPSQVEVYVDSNTQTLNTQALAAGNTMRFYGLVFNDNGTLRMDCAQINDGVALSTQSNSTKPSAPGHASSVVRAGPRGTQLVNTMITNAH